MKKQIKPIGKNILIKIEEQKETKSGIALPSNHDYIQEYAEVVAIGDEVTRVKAGQTIVFKSWALNTVIMPDRKLTFVEEDKLLAVI